MTQGRTRLCCRQKTLPGQQRGIVWLKPESRRFGAADGPQAGIRLRMTSAGPLVGNCAGRWSTVPSRASTARGHRVCRAGHRLGNAVNRPLLVAMDAIGEGEAGHATASAPPASVGDDTDGEEDAPSNGARQRLASPAEGQDAREEVAALRRQVRELQKLVSAQGELAEEQRRALAELRRAVAVTGNGVTPTGGEAASAATPFEAQTVGIGDRRYAGLFDARFHSLNRWGNACLGV